MQYIHTQCDHEVPQLPQGGRVVYKRIAVTNTRYRGLNTQPILYVLYNYIQSVTSTRGFCIYLVVFVTEVQDTIEAATQKV